MFNPTGNRELGPYSRSFNPYANNGGTIIAIAGKDYAVIGSDTRLSDQNLIITRYANKLFELTDSTVVGCSGCWCDILTFTRVVIAKVHMYKQIHNKVIPTEAIAQMLSTTLYFKRLFPYYIATVVVGLDNEGEGCVYNYDPIGHFEKTKYYACGTGGLFANSILDNRVGFKNLLKITPREIDADEAVGILKEAFVAVAERDIYTGDGVDIDIITKDGIERCKFGLRKD